MPENPNAHPYRAGFLYRLIHMDPAIWRALVVATVALLASVGVVVTPAIPDAIVGFVVVIVPLVQGLWTRSAVTPNEKVLVYVPDPIDRPGVVRPGEALTTAPEAAIVNAAENTPAKV